MATAIRPLSVRGKNFLSHASRSRGFLWKFATGMILVGAFAGYLAGRTQPAQPAKFGERVLVLSGIAPTPDDPDDSDPSPRAEKNSVPADILPAFEAELREPAVKIADFVWAVPLLAPHLNPGDLERAAPILRQRFSAAEAELAVNYLGAWNLADHPTQEALRLAAESAHPVRLAGFAAGQIEMRRKDYAAAARYFRREGERPAAFESRYGVIRALLAANDFPALIELEGEPAYRDLFSPYEAMKIAANHRDWAGLLKGVVRGQIESYQNPLMLVALVAGLGWAFFLAHLGECPGIFSRPALLCLLAFAGGFVSTTPTLYIAVVEEDILHFVRGGDLYRIFAYDIGGVAVREELCKLLCFLPLLPFVVRRGNELEAVMVAGFVGLGFAIEENSGYFLRSGATDAAGRFLSANFFHVALTGMNGLALFRACTRGLTGLNEFLFILPLTILAHGAYDALLDAKSLQGGDYAGMAVFVAFSLHYFSQVQPLRENRRMTIGLTGSFVFGISLLVGVLVAYQMATLGVVAGAAAIFPELLGSGALLLMFFRIFDEPLLP